MTTEMNRSGRDTPEPIKHIDRFDDDGGHFVPDSPRTVFSHRRPEPGHPRPSLAGPALSPPHEVPAGLAVSARRQRRSWDDDTACFDAILGQAGLLEDVVAGKLRPLSPRSI